MARWTQAASDSVAETLESGINVARDFGYSDKVALWSDAMIFTTPNRLAMVKRQPALQAKLRALEAEVSDWMAYVINGAAR